MTGVSRRWFIGGAASFGAFAGCRFFKCHDLKLVAVPAPVQTKASRLLDLEFLAETKSGKRILKRVRAEGYNHSLAHPKAKSDQECLFAAGDFLNDEVRFLVTPIGNFRLRGKTIASEWISCDKGDAS